MMKRLFLFLLLLPACCFGQNFEFGINGGLCFHSLPAQNSFVYDDKPTLAVAGSLRADLSLPGVQIGVGVEMTKLSEFNYLIPPYNIRQNVLIANPLITPHAFLNKTIRLRSSSYLYGGVMAGPVLARVGVNNWVYDNNNVVTGYSTSYNSVTGFAAGLQLGVVLSINNRLGLNAEAATRYTSFTYKDFKSTMADNPYSYKLFYFPMTIGLRYRI